MSIQPLRTAAECRAKASLLRGMAIGTANASLSRHLIATADEWSALAESVEAMEAAQAGET